MTVDPPHYGWHSFKDFVVLCLPSCVIFGSSEEYLLLILEKILPILSTCAVKVSTYPFFIANSQGKQLDFCERTSLFNLKLFLCSIALCMEFVLSPFSFYSGSFGLLPLRLDWEGSSDGVFIYSQCLAHSGHIKTFEK